MAGSSELLGHCCAQPRDCNGHQCRYLRKIVGLRRYSGLVRGEKSIPLRYLLKKWSFGIQALVPFPPDPGTNYFAVLRRAPLFIAAAIRPATVAAASLTGSLARCA